MPWTRSGSKTHRDTAQKTFEENNALSSSDLPSITAAKTDLLVDIAANISGMSKSEIRRLMDQGGVKINDQPLSVDLKQAPLKEISDLKEDLKLSLGKKRHFIIKIK